MSSHHRLFQDVYMDTNDCQNNLVEQDILATNSFSHDSVNISEESSRNVCAENSSGMVNPSSSQGNSGADNCSSKLQYECTSCQHMFTKQHARLFKDYNYNAENTIVQQFMSIRLKRSNVIEEFICKPCHRALLKVNPILPRCMNRQKLYNCCICNHEYNEKQTCNFDINNYNQDSSVLRHILSENSTCDISGQICKQCHAKLN